MSINASKKIIILNTLAYLVSFISLTLGIAVFFITGFLPILFVELFIGIGLLTVPFLIRRIGYRATLLLVFFVLNCALCFYSIILGPQAQLHTVVPFLVGGALILTDNIPAKIIACSYTLLLILLLQISYYYHWFTPIPIPTPSTQFITWIVITTGVTLSCSIIYFFFKYWVNAREKRLMTRLEKANKALRKADQNKSVFVRELGHELRNEITTIFALAELLHEGSPNTHDEENATMIEDLISASHQVTLTCNNLLEHAKKENNVKPQLLKSSFPIRVFFLKNLKLNQYRANSKHIRLELEINDMPSNIISDHHRLNQILNNLLINAIRYSVPYSTIFIKVHTIAEDRWCMEVSDSGPGISEERQKQVFDAFFTDSSMRGTGLGLAISQRLAHELDGEISLRSIEGEGSTFTVTFKLLQNDLQDIPVKKELAIETTGAKTGSVLIIDDDEIVTKAMELALRPLFKTIITAADCKTGLKYAEASIPDVIILDYNLPDGNGIETLKIITKNPSLAHVQTFVVSGINDENARDEIIAAGAKSFITKPFSLQNLRSAISSSIPKKAV